MGKTGRKNRSYSAEFKIGVIMDMREHRLGYRETTRKYNLGKSGGAVATIQRWERIFLEEGAEGLMKERRGRACAADLQQVRDMLSGLFAKLPETARPVFHSDQGWQYQHTEYQRLLAEHNITQSMSRKGNCVDNGAMENFFGRLKVMRAIKDPALMNGSRRLSEELPLTKLIDFMRPRLRFNTTQDNISPYLEISLDEISESPVKEWWRGPKNRSALCDVELYLDNCGFKKVDIKRSRVSYI